MRKKQKNEEPADSNGLSVESSLILDTILTIIGCGLGKDDMWINLELRRCGFYLSMPDQKKYMDKLIEDGHIKRQENNDIETVARH